MSNVGIVLVSHSYQLVEGLKVLLAQLSSDVSIVSAGGTEDDGIGTSASKIKDAIKSIYNERGVIVFLDLGSALINTELAIEWLAEEGINQIKIADSPLVEGSYVAVVESGCGKALEEIYIAALEAKNIIKI
ncbi:MULTISPECIES: dihydroxyacetone kinase phosphoryl donor subunit DhaM [Bacillus]|uniref:phosphoenolpyruvate--glycerone phosphotransferase n=1 Tax=Bacillus thuringiensis serovar toumanoffi TaxID=180862 RepID=A0ABD5I9A8_BACTU|nr:MULTISPECIES: dihydroxyacetone kinase phosphoryl donor subunit DhaM [Bacillus cereus group]MBJ7966344.1 PTS-dependent dihydroxyacetone kinase phosphotransferase subunit DhaM [Bacillus cereus]MBJ8002106.1 PTS-dependent dihydroxyacetone kinase phosphotransferase subunit DhaM [Bacillus cereus]MCC6080687.1 PTS-dependent dihydroxyacetone kinase phosphotransferase subunit DhaM [Bacillus thuringiensis]MCR6784264.1 dihydroxyacetone kinase phosphoryl donor subunit DhaM [Bacillus thuringiensis]MCR686